jgi:quercetin dioxygenase-like cupin family protein
MKRGSWSKVLLSGMLAIVPLVSFAACDPYADGACTEMLLDTTTTWDGAPMKYLKTKNPELTIRTIQFSPTTYNNWHAHEAPIYIYVMSGDFEVIMVDKHGTEQRRTFHAGEAFNEVVNTTHRGGNPSYSEWTKLLVMSPSEIGCPFMTPNGSRRLCKGNGNHNGNDD